MSASLSLYCRLCAEQKSVHELVDLTSNAKFREDFVEKLSIFSSHPIDLSIKTLPETVCIKCIQTLTSTYDFYTKIKMSQLDLLRLISSILRTDLDSNNSFDYHNSELDYLRTESPKTEVNDDTEFKITFNGFNITLCDQKYEETSLVTWSTYPWCCKHCDVQVGSVGALRNHSKECHGVCFSVKCVDCKDDFYADDFDSFVQHVRSHRRELKQFCHHCNIKLEPETASDHVKVHNIQPHCFVCGEFFVDDVTLHAHLSKYQRHAVYDVSWKEYEWVCKECNTKLTDQDSLRVHVKEVHQKCFGMQCADCTDTVESFNAFVDHVRVHKPSLKYYCQFCNIKFQDAQHTIIHISQHLFNQCEKCGESFPSTQSLRSHTKTYNKKPKRYKRKKAITQQDLTCDVCQKVTKSVNNLQAHKILHTDRKRDHTCDRCGKAFFTKGALTSHNVIHQNPDPEVCQICKNTFLTVTRLKKHVKTHYVERNFQCDVCHKCFKLKDQLKCHMACHSNVMPFSCQYCDKTFRFRNVLKSHQTLHTGARPYNCRICRMEFANWSNCNKHMLRRHGATLAKSVLTPQGKVPLNSKTGKPKKVQDLALMKDWSEQVLGPRKRGKKK